MDCNNVPCTFVIKMYCKARKYTNQLKLSIDWPFFKNQALKYDYLYTVKWNYQIYHDDVSSIASTVDVGRRRSMIESMTQSLERIQTPIAQIGRVYTIQCTVYTVYSIRGSTSTDIQYMNQSTRISNILNLSIVSRKTYAHLKLMNYE